LTILSHTVVAVPKIGAVGIVVRTWATGVPERLSSIVSPSRAAPVLNSQSSLT
jgi:hypothetical protein